MRKENWNWNWNGKINSNRNRSRKLHNTRNCPPVVPRGDDLAVVLPVEGGRPEVDEPDLGALHLPHVLPLAGVVGDLPVRAREQDVLRLEVRVG